MKKIISILLLLVGSFLFAEEPTETIEKVLSDYPNLLNEYEKLLNDYETLLNEYDTLLTKYENLSKKYSDLTNQFNNLNELYKAEITYHENSIKALQLSKESITILQENINNLLKISDTKYMTLFIHAGYLVNSVNVGSSFTIDIPKLPLSFIINIQYFNVFNIQTGIGIKF